VICTVYSWTLKLTEPLGIKWPIKAFVHQRYLTTPLPSRLRIPAVNADPLGGYVRAATGNRILAGIETSERTEFRVPNTDFQMASVSADPALRNTLKRNLVSLLPALDKTTWDVERVGLLTFSMDGEPILGPVKQLPGFYLAAAFHSGGFAYNPVAGYLMAECVADGRTSIDVTAFSPNRFDSRQVEAYLASTSAQKDAVRRRH
jgi:glycine/D-amino acid oxidase-like deaminating enzyme